MLFGGLLCISNWHVTLYTSSANHGQSLLSAGFRSPFSPPMSGLPDGSTGLVQCDGWWKDTWILKGNRKTKTTLNHVNHGLVLLALLFKLNNTVFEQSPRTLHLGALHFFLSTKSLLSYCHMLEGTVHWQNIFIEWQDLRLELFAT